MNTSNAPIFVKADKLPIYSISPFTALDFPDKTACIAWFAGCNMRCPYCYNPDIVLGKGKLGYSDLIAFLNKRKGLLDAVVLSGGECTLHQGLLELCHTIKEMGFQIKIDTNGSRPEVLKKAVEEELIDYIALDYKAPEKTYRTVTQSKLYPRFEQSLALLLQSDIAFEVRTTVHSALLSESDLHEMVTYLEDKGYRGKLFLQHFVSDTATLQTLPPSDYRVVRKIYSTEAVKVLLRN
ncbi:anaerobic ribonucleoside-triphosphate reductase activating protein [Cytophagales bacterium LB-30]|uniref:Anaerobic ribonucleoside-triphosphate reductase activating protein n=1 Tax=Shiella aurantiaca TaxID=3058365 RepID=A0ABT8F3Q3_9BACT|nr:anaerobic ribonucleoside-triphosphate reductase activating protein [Shiella aurantiaca]MDN4165008.1 anaerobic ribonucleoside-triphosphate reductase activating protein [Shiella aurantiaca]